MDMHTAARARRRRASSPPRSRPASSQHSSGQPLLERAAARPPPHRAAGRPSPRAPRRPATRTSPRARRRPALSPSPAACLFCSGRLPPSNLPHLALPRCPPAPTPQRHLLLVGLRRRSALSVHSHHSRPFNATTRSGSPPPFAAAPPLLGVASGALPLFCFSCPSPQLLAVFFGWIMLEISHRLFVFVNCDLLWSWHDEDTTDFDPTLPGGCSDGLRVTT